MCAAVLARSVLIATDVLRFMVSGFGVTDAAAGLAPTRCAMWPTELPRNDAEARMLPRPTAATAIAAAAGARRRGRFRRTSASPTPWDGSYGAARNAPVQPLISGRDPAPQGQPPGWVSGNASSRVGSPPS